MLRFEIGSRVRMVGGVAEHYTCTTAVVIGVNVDPQGLWHLNKYRVSISGGREETFYEFQLADQRAEAKEKPLGAA